MSLVFLGIIAQITPSFAQTTTPVSVDEVKPLEVPQGTSRDLNGLSQPDLRDRNKYQIGNPIEAQQYQIPPETKPANPAPLLLEWPNKGEPPSSGGTVPLVNF
ncbi:MAG: hypothetical protein Cpurp_08800 [Chlorogloea purpurea SAG 13.99]|nr:hypothetical protein [Chlorogloea purpurea SAG 13.99]